MSNRGVLYWRICPTRIRIWWIYIYICTSHQVETKPKWHKHHFGIAAGVPFVVIVYIWSGATPLKNRCSSFLLGHHPFPGEKINHAVNGHIRNRLIGGTYHIYIYGLFFREYPIISPQFIWPEIWYVYLHLLDPEDLPCCLHRFPQGDRLIARSLEPWLGPGITRGENWGRENGLLGILKYHFEVSVRTHPLFSWVMFN